MLDQLMHWGMESWRNEVSIRIERVVDPSTTSDERERSVDQLKLKMEWYEQVKGLSVLELALWKLEMVKTLGYGDEKERNEDRNACRIKCGAETIIPIVKELIRAQ